MFGNTDFESALQSVLSGGDLPPMNPATGNVNPPIQYPPQQQPTPDLPPAMMAPGSPQMNPNLMGPAQPFPPGPGASPLPPGDPAAGGGAVGGGGGGGGGGPAPAAAAVPLPVPLPVPQPPMPAPQPPPVVAGPPQGGPPLPPFGAPQPSSPQGDPSSRNVLLSREIAGGLGAGLKSVGSNWNKPGLAAFAGSAGSAIEGGEKAQADYFNQSSAAFKDALGLQNSDNTMAYRSAQAKYLAARAQAIMANGGTGAATLKNSLTGQVLTAESRVQTYAEGQRKIAEAQMKLDGKPIDEAALAQRVDTYRQGLYKNAGIDPDKAEKIKTMGMSQDNPFDASKMPSAEFHATVPIGAWYKVGDKIYQRTKPPPGTGAPQQLAPNAMEPPQQAPNADDMQAMTPA